METLAINNKNLRTRSKTSARLSHEQRAYDQSARLAEKADDLVKTVYFLGEIATIGARKIINKIKGVEKPAPNYVRVAANMMALSSKVTSEAPAVAEQWLDDEVFLGDEANQQENLDIAA